jgi:hypothetical protein
MEGGFSQKGVTNRKELSNYFSQIKKCLFNYRSSILEDPAATLRIFWLYLTPMKIKKAENPEKSITKLTQ